jgi:hypothetical protein
MLNLEKFKELFRPLPGNHYLQVSTCRDEITELLEELMSSVDGELNLVLYNEENLALDKPFRAVPRDHDNVILKDVYSKHQNQDMLIKLSYLTLANTANIIILEKKGLLDIEHIKQKLESYEFRAANEIDIIDGYDLIIAKKMHMWGNGL